ncbi:MAG: indole-3-glycerol phosphate synthase TrpC [Opitutaceae bacterium]|nr:indole-3-glycerol phosphate synthase TrpC [Opitutaceae bacterium]
MDKLTEIMANKRREIAPLLRPVFADELAQRHKELPKPPSFAGALKRPDGKLAIIAEIKRRSPSAGAIREGISALEQAKLYQTAGADAISVLTDQKYFGGTIEDLTLVTEFFRGGEPAGAGLSNAPLLPPGHPKAPPCLRKDFMVHPLQVLEARVAGASAILIIVRALTDDEISSLQDAARAARLDVLFEVHNEAEIDRALKHGAKIIGINNRDLATFSIDLAVTERLIAQLPPDTIIVSESGIQTAMDAARVHAAGAHAVLVGEALMKVTSPATLIDAFHAV